MIKKGRDRRKFKRGFLQLRVRFTLKRKTGEGYMTNLSEGGCLIYCYSAAPIPIDAILKLNFNLNKSFDDIVVKSRVVRVMPFVRKEQDLNYALGVQFLDLEEKQRKQIFSYIQQVLTDIREEQTANG